MTDTNIETTLAAEIGRLRAVLSEQRALIRKLLHDRDNHVATIMQAKTALIGIEVAAAEIERDKPVLNLTEEAPPEPPASRAQFIRSIAGKINAAAGG